jgi:hypothetical protein
MTARFITLNHFFLWEGCHPWIVCLNYLGESVAYKRSVDCLEAFGDDVDVKKLGLSSYAADGSLSTAPIAPR